MTFKPAADQLKISLCHVIWAKPAALFLLTGLRNPV